MLARMRSRLAERRDVERRVEAIERRFERLEEGLRESWATTAEALRRLEEQVARRQQVSGTETLPLDGVELRDVLWAIASEEPLTRRRLWEARARPEYELAYTEADPLVSVLIPTHDRPELLRDRSVPSVLGQTHANVEVVVVGDAAGSATEEALRSLGDDRVRFRDLPHRIVSSDEPRQHWLVAATMTRNEAARMARGRWLVALDDDDELHPECIATLLELARADRAEVAYGVLREVRAGDDDGAIGAFPPRPGAFSWGAALAHESLRVFDRQWVAAAFGMPGDWYLLERMLRVGVRFAFTPAEVASYFPSQG